MDINPSQFLHFLSLHCNQKSKSRSLFVVVSLLLLFILAYNCASIFCLHVAILDKFPPERAGFSPGKWPSSSKVFSTVMLALKEENPPSMAKTDLLALRKSQKCPSSSANLSSTVTLALNEENAPSMSRNHLLGLKKSQNLDFFLNHSMVSALQRRQKHEAMFKMKRSKVRSNLFSARVKEFFHANSCKLRFFMTWISSLESFGDRESFAMQSLFKSNPNSCLIIVSNSMDSSGGIQVLRPFLSKGLRVIAISPDFDYLLKHTVAEAWFNRLRRRMVDPGEVPLGQNLSNLVRLLLLYKFGGVYLDTDVVVLKSFKLLKNVIGAQTTDAETGNWSRLNNAVMVFDKGHPLLYKFIQEFALTFDGNKWGHNGPYLVSRVVSRVNGRVGFDFRVLSPVAFYPVDWSRIGSLFRGPRNESHSKWLTSKLNRIRRHSHAVHLWNKQSRELRVEEGSIIGQLMSVCCVFCNSSESKPRVK